MSAIQEILSIVPNVIINSGDETRSDCAMDLAAIILKNFVGKCKSKVNKFRNKAYIVPLQEFVYISCLDHRIKYDIYKGTTTDEILNVITGWVNSKYNDLDFYVTHCYKPVREGFTLREFGITHGSNLQVQVRLRGGCIIDNNQVKPYSQSVVIENSVMSQHVDIELQNNTYTYELYKDVLNFDLDAISHILNNELQLKNLSINKEYILGLIEDVYFFYEDAKHYDFRLALIRFFKYRGFKTVEFIKTFIEFFTGLELQNKEYFDNIWAFLKSDFFKKAFSIISFVILRDSLSKLKIELSNNSVLEILMKTIKSFIMEDSKWDPIYAIVRSIRDVLCAIKRWYDSGDINALYNEHYVDDKWFKKSSELIINSAYLSNAEEHGVDVYSYLSDLDINIEVGENNLRTFRGDSRRKAILQKTVLDLKRIRADELTRNAAMKSRPSPFALLVYGGSSVGKSTFVEILFGFYGNLFKLNTDPSFRYARNGIDEYWSNFRTSHWCILFDDAAYMKPDIATNGDPSVMEIIQTINNIPFIPAQAELQDKGRTPVRCQLVLATTNSENLNAVHYFSCPLAVQRRFPFVIDLKPKKDFARDDSPTMLDPLKIPKTVKGEYPNLWEITVKKVEVNANDHNQASLIPVEEFDDIYQFLRWYGKQAKAHKETQVKISHSLDIIRNNEVCDKCYSIVDKCICLELQNCVSTDGFNPKFNIIAYISAFIITVFIWFTCKNTINYNEVKNIFKIKCREYLWRYTKYRIMSMCNYVHWKKCSAILALLTALGIVLKQLRKTKFAMHGAELSSISPTEMIFKKDEQENVWYNQHVELVPADLPEPSRSIGDFDQFKSLVARNTALLRIKNLTTKMVSDGQAFNITGNYWITNYHNVERVNDNDEIWMELIRSNSQGLNCNVKCRIDTSMITQVRKTDLVLLEVKCTPPGKDMKKFVPKQVLTGVHEGVYIIRDKNGNIYHKKVSNIKQFHSVGFENYESDDAYIGVPEVDTIKGESGAIFIIKTPQGPVLAGLHQAGHNNISVAICMFSSDIPQNEISEGALRLSVQGYEKTLGDLHPKSVTRWVKDGSCNVYGTFAGFRPKPKSRVQPTFICEVAEKYGYIRKQGKPEMNGWEIWRNAFVPMVQQPRVMTPGKLRRVSEALIKDLSKVKLNLGILNKRQCVNGIPGVKYIDSINKSSSMGFPWSQSKKNFLIDARDEEYPDGVDFPDEIWELVDIIIKNYLEGKSNKPIYTAHAKDEPRSLKKILAKLTRIFAGAPIDYSLVVRMVLLCFVKAVQENRELFEAAPGLNCHSLEWHGMYGHMTQFGFDRFIAGDYGNFDKAMIAEVIMEAFYVIEQIHKINGCSEEHLKLIRGIAVDTAYNFQNFNGDLIQFFGSNPSGHPLTVIINGLANSIYMRYVYAELNPKGFIPETFKEDVILMTYGDDNFMNVREGCDWFNHTAIQNLLASVGIKYTMADKEAESVPYIHISEVSFLKRTFRYDNDLNCYVAPLEHDSINKMLTMQVKSKTVSEQAQSLAAIQSAIREYFFYGKEEFEKRRVILKNIINESGLSNYLYQHYCDDGGNIIQSNSDLPTWEELKDSFFYNSRHIRPLPE